MIIRRARKEDVFEISKVHVDTWISTYSSIIPEDYLKNRTYESQKNKWMVRLFDNESTTEFMYVAQDECGKVVGFASGDKNNENCDSEGILYTLYILKEYQNRGLGKLLVKKVASKFSELGIKSMILWAFEQNDACNFYEHLGGKQFKKRIINIAGNDLVEVAYRWDDISVCS